MRGFSVRSTASVSYTHLDVYKRQVLSAAAQDAPSGSEAHRARYGEDLPRLGPDGAGSLGRGQPHARS